MNVCNFSSMVTSAMFTFALLATCLVMSDASRKTFVTFNAALIPRIPNGQTRVEALTNAMNSIDADVVCMQEVHVWSCNLWKRKKYLYLASACMYALQKTPNQSSARLLTFVSTYNLKLTIILCTYCSADELFCSIKQFPMKNVASAVTFQVSVTESIFICVRL